jgi:hypothetical protein
MPSPVPHLACGLITEYSGRQLQVVACKHRPGRLEQRCPAGGLQRLRRLVYDGHIKGMLLQVGVQHAGESGAHHLQRHIKGACGRHRTGLRWQWVLMMVPLAWLLHLGIV